MLNNIRKTTIVLLCAALVLLCGCTEKVEIAGEKLPVDSQELSMVLDAEQIALLDQLPALTTVDLSGSDCYEEISGWAQAHPQVDVRYTVTFPEGTVAAAEALTFPLLPRPMLRPRLSFLATSRSLRSWCSCPVISHRSRWRGSPGPQG